MLYDNAEQRTPDQVQDELGFSNQSDNHGHYCPCGWFSLVQLALQREVIVININGVYTERLGPN